MSTLPDEYLKLKWIESTGTQSITTNIIPQTTYNVEVKAIKRDANTSLFGVGSAAYALTGKYGANYFYVGRSTSSAEDRQYITISDQSAVHIWGIKNKIGYCDNISASAVYGDNQPTDEFALFGRNHEGVVSDQGKNRIFYAKMDDGNENLLLDMIPCLRTADMKPGMYDLVSNIFYTNNGTGEFIYELESYKTNLSNSANILHGDKTCVDTQAESYKTIIYFKGE